MDPNYKQRLTMCKRNNSPSYSFKLNLNTRTKTVNCLKDIDSPCLKIQSKNIFKSPPFRRAYYIFPYKHSLIGDRYIPYRSLPAFSNASNSIDILNVCPLVNIYSKQSPINTNDYTHDSNKEIITYSCLLNNEILGTSISNIPSLNCTDVGTRNIIPRNHAISSIYNFSPRNCYKSSLTDIHNPTISPLTISSQKLLLSPKRDLRKISKTPFKVLDAPELQDDYYLNLLDWSCNNQLAVGLGTSVYLWNATTSQVIKLHDFNSEADCVTSVCWSEQGSKLAVGTRLGVLGLWDVTTNKRISNYLAHSERISSLAWNNQVVCSGSRDKCIYQWDSRSLYQNSPIRSYLFHTQEVCGLKWSYDKQYLASGGNDNKLLIWAESSPTPIHRFLEHRAAIKAIAWSPHQHCLLASGGGTQDKKIRFWNVTTGQQLISIDTGSQVCNLCWSIHSQELVSTHGFSQNEILIWKYPSLCRVSKLTGHASRVLFLAISPDGQTIVTGAGDETLRFWNVFTKSHLAKDSSSPLTEALFNVNYIK